MRRRHSKNSALENLAGGIFAAIGMAVVLSLLWLNRDHIIDVVMPGAEGDAPPLPQVEPVQAQVVDSATLQRTLDNISERKRAEEEARLQAIRDAEEAKRIAEEAQRSAVVKARREADAATRAAADALRG
ncbi:MAG: hypothetical protein Q4D61_04775, partial [Cardiobacteriaceae bacterium]|nr:hypothetical protein [Cardiobacteriaceae bacterium]